jgi:hypothetical protein
MLGTIVYNSGKISYHSIDSFCIGILIYVILFVVMFLLSVYPLGIMAVKSE